MGCDLSNSAQKQVLNLTWASDAKGYNPLELDRIILYIDQTVAWLNQIQASDDEDLFVYRIGTPLAPSYKETDTEAIVGVDIEPDTYILGSVGVDCIKVTSKYKLVDNVVTKQVDGYNCTYTYKSASKHAILGNYYIDGIGNTTGWSIPAIILPPMFGSDEPRVIREEVVHPKLDYIDSSEYNVSLSVNGGVPVQYGGVKTIPITTTTNADNKVVNIGIPDFVVNCALMLVQNVGLMRDFGETNATDAEGKLIKTGDLVYTTIGRLKHKLDIAKTACVQKKKEFYSKYYEDIRFMLEFTGMDQAFKDVQYGGLIEHLDIVLRIPASYENEKLLLAMIEDKEVADYCGVDVDEVTEVHRKTFFDHVFIAEMIMEDAFNDPSSHAKSHMLLDIDNVRTALGRLQSNTAAYASEDEDIWEINQWFNKGYAKDSASDRLEINGLAMPLHDGTKGCKYQYTSTYCDESTTSLQDDGQGNWVSVTTCTSERTKTVTQYRHYYINAAWLDGLDYVRVASLFWLGLDVSSATIEACPYDTIIVVVIIIILTYLQLHNVAKWVWYHYLALASAIMSIGLTLGAFGTGKAARNVAIAAAIFSLASGYGYLTAPQAGATTAATVGFAMDIAGTGLSVYSTMETYKHDKFMEESTKELAKLTEDGEVYASSLRFMYEDSYRLATNLIEVDPYDAIRDVYKDFRSYNTKGFREV